MIVLECGKSLAIAPEGLESFGMLGSGQGKSSLTSFIGYVNPRWVTDYQSFQVYFGTPTYQSGYLTYGGSITIGNGFSNRNAYFVRHDFLLLPTTSISLKLLHEDYSYIPSAHDSVGLEFNSFVPWSSQSGI